MSDETYISDLIHAEKTIIIMIIIQFVRSLFFINSKIVRHLKLAIALAIPVTQAMFNLIHTEKQSF